MPASRRVARLPRERGFSAAGGERLQKLLAACGLGSRREMEEWIRAGRVTVNGVRARLGVRVGPSDVIRVDGKRIAPPRRPQLPRVLLYHKPEGEIVSRGDPEGRPTVFERLPRVKGAKWLAVGRLDFNSCGLLIFTTSGELANRMMHPRFGLEREYAVRVRGALSPEDTRRLLRGIELDAGLARLETIAEAGGGGTNRWYRVVVKEGRTHVVRRLFGALGHSVSRLMRVRFGSVRLPPRLRRGCFAELSRAEVRELLAALGPAQ